MSLPFAFIPFPQIKGQSVHCCPETKSKKQSLQWQGRDSMPSAVINHEFLISDIYKTPTANIYNVVSNGTKHRNQDQ